MGYCQVNTNIEINNVISGKDGSLASSNNKMNIKYTHTI